MIFVKHDNGEINYIHQMPFDAFYGLGKSKEELEQEGLLFESLPESESISGKKPVLALDTTTNELFYKYEDVVVEKTEIQELQEEISLMKKTNSDLTYQLLMKGVL